MSSNIDEDMLSSPDPLNDSPTYTSPVKPRPQNRKSFPFGGSSPRKQTFELNVGDKVSPQKIRVTVEAEASGKENINFTRSAKVKPTRQQRGSVIRCDERTTTTTIPVKGLSDSEDSTVDTPVQTPKRGRGRPRKSGGTPVTSKTRTRTVTPHAKPGRRRTLGQLVDDDDDDGDFAIGAGVEMSRGKRRSRSRSFRENPSTSAPASEQADPPQRSSFSSTARKSSRGRRKTLAPEDVEILDEYHTESSNEVQNDDHAVKNVGHRVLAEANGNSRIPEPALLISRVEIFDGGHDDSSDDLLNTIDMGRRSPQPTGQLYTVNPENSHPPSKEDYPIVAHDIEAYQTTTSESLSPSPCGVDDYDVGVEYEIDESPEFDTVLESEGFSMISVDAVPSLREHLSSPAIDDCSASDLHKVSLSSRNVIARAQSTSSRATFQSLTNPKVSSIRAAYMPQTDDSFSSIPPEVLDAATPGGLMQKNRLLFLRKQEEARIDDSFSSIPSAILDAATPARHRQRHIGAVNVFAPQERPELISPTMLVSSESSAKPSSQQRALSRLITPEETPPASETITGSSFLKNSVETLGSTGNHSMHCERHIGETSMEGSSTLMRSSPPTIPSQRQSHEAEILQDRSVYPDVIETPSIMFSSPSLPPPLQQAYPRKATTNSESELNDGTRIGLTPSVKAAQALQDITMPSPASRDLSQNLGSPFKSPSMPRRSVSSPRGSSNSRHSKEAIEKAENWTSGTDAVFGAFSSTTRREIHMNDITGAKFASVKERVNAINEDPFRHSGPMQLRSPSPEDKNQYNLAVPGQQEAAPLSHSVLGHNPEDLRNDTSMDWQCKIGSPNELPSPDATSSITSSEDEPELDLWQSAAESVSLREQRKEEGFSHDKAVLSQQTEIDRTGQVVVNDSDKADSTYGAKCEIDRVDTASDTDIIPEEDIWMVEARSSSSLLEDESSRDVARLPRVDKPKRSKLPSPWRQNSKRLVYSDELGRSSFSHKETSREHQQHVITEVTSAASVDNLIPHQYSSQEENERLARLQPQPPKPEFVPELLRRGTDTTELPQRTPAGLTEFRQASCQIQSESYGLSELSMLQPIPQKSKFAPKVRTRDSEHLNLSVFFGSSPVKISTTSSAIDNQNRAGNDSALKEILERPSYTAPPVISASAEEESCMWDTTDIIEGSMFQPAPLENSLSGLTIDSRETAADSGIASLPVPADQPILDGPTQSLPFMSPRKSCFRTSIPSNSSPTKSVVFTGISSSPSVVTTASDSSVIITPTPAPTSQARLARTAPVPLSPSTWTQAHWKRLNRIYQDAKQAPAQPRGSCVSALLGKAVRARGEKLVLTEFHLDVVACFRDEVPGWDEESVVRRLFGLVVDEERKAGVRERGRPGKEGPAEMAC